MMKEKIQEKDKNPKSTNPFDEDNSVTDINLEILALEKQIDSIKGIEEQKQEHENPKIGAVEYETIPTTTNPVVTKNPEPAAAPVETVETLEPATTPTTAPEESRWERLRNAAIDTYNNLKANPLKTIFKPIKQALDYLEKNWKKRYGIIAGIAVFSLLRERNPNVFTVIVRAFLLEGVFKVANFTKNWIAPSDYYLAQRNGAEAEPNAGVEMSGVESDDIENNRAVLARQTTAIEENNRVLEEQTAAMQELTTAINSQKRSLDTNTKAVIDETNRRSSKRSSRKNAPTQS